VEVEAARAANRPASAAAGLVVWAAHYQLTLRQCLPAVGAGQPAVKGSVGNRSEEEMRSLMHCRPLLCRGCVRACTCASVYV